MKQVNLLFFNILIVLIVSYLFSWSAYKDNVAKKNFENEKNILIIHEWFNKQYFILSEIIPKYRENFSHEKEFLSNAVKFTGLQYLVYFDGVNSYSNFSHLNSIDNPDYMIENRPWFNTDKTITSPFIGRYSQSHNVSIIYRKGKEKYISILDLKLFISFINRESIYGVDVDMIITNSDNDVLYGNQSYGIGSIFTGDGNYHCNEINLWPTSDHVNVYFLNEKMDFTGYLWKHSLSIIFSFFILCVISMFSLFKWNKFYNKYYSDALTGCKNRHFLSKYIYSFKGYLILIDLDNFKVINDTKGHQSGDEVLIQFVAFLTESFPNAHVIRYGGDEFLIVTSKEYSDIDFDNITLSFNKQFSEFDTLGFSYSQQAISSDFFGAIHFADESMYKQKREKKE